MRQFTQLFVALDESNRTGEKLAALQRYFATAPAGDAAWGLWFLMGNKLGGISRGRALLESAAALAELPMWLAEESYGVVGDLAETLSLLIDCPGGGTGMSLCELVQERLLPLKEAADAARIERIHALWRQMDQEQCLVLNKLLTGAFRVGASRTLVVRALAAVAGVEQAVMAHRVMGRWRPTAAQYRAFLEAPGGGSAAPRDPAQPYPFYLASPLEGQPAQLGPIGDWQAEWKWDGIRCQLLRREGRVLLWSRGEELIGDAFPELALEAARVPEGTVLDGELLAWSEGRPLPFATLQKRLGRKEAGALVQRRSPVAFLAYDCLEWRGEDIRVQPMHRRRAILEELIRALRESAPEGRRLGVAATQEELFVDHTTGSPADATAAPGNDALMQLSPLVEAVDWDALARLWSGARERGVEGLMLKRKDGPYRAGRVRGEWWKWKIDPLTVDAVVIYAQLGHGKRASLFSDYTFAVWDGGTLVPVAKAYSGLSDDELRQVDAWIKRNSLDKHGPVRVVKPELVMEVAFEGIQASTRHRSGVALRFPRIARWRRDKRPQDADTLERLRELMEGEGGRS